MGKSWDFYFCLVESKLASIMVDMDPQASRSDLPDMAYLRLFMKSPRADGLSSEQEYPALVAIEDALELGAEQKEQAVYVGRNTTDGFRDFVYYAAHGRECEQTLSNAMTAFPDYKFEIGSRSDPSWQAYREFLYPNDRQRQTMENRHVYDSLRNNGDALSAPRDIDHWIYFQSTYSRSVFIGDCRALGFDVRALHESGTVSSEVGVQIFRVDTPNPDQFDEVTLKLFDMAESLGGRYDGWEAKVIR